MSSKWTFVPDDNAPSASNLSSFGGYARNADGRGNDRDNRGDSSNSNDDGQDDDGTDEDGGAQGEQPCTGVAEAIQDITGGASNQDFVDDVVDNFVNTKDSAASTVLDLGASLGGGGTAAAAYYGTTPLKAIGLAITGYSSAVRIPGLLGSATPLQLFGTAAATWAVNFVLIKGSYNAGVLIGSVARTAANRAATAACGK